MTIKQKQWQLYYLGYYGGEIDGIWGTLSKAAAVRFQKDYDLDADGIFGTLTIAKSIEIIKSIQKEITNGKIAIDGLAGRDRAELKGVGFVSSGLRCSQHNANVGGVSDSRHLNRKAIDLRIEGKSAGQTLAWAQRQPEVRYAYAIDANFIHMDIE